MPYFRWKGRNPRGKVVKGEIIAANKNEAIAKLKTKRVSVIFSLMKRVLFKFMSKR